MKKDSGGWEDNAMADGLSVTDFDAMGYCNISTVSSQVMMGLGKITFTEAVQC